MHKRMYSSLIVLLLFNVPAIAQGKKNNAPAIDEGALIKALYKAAEADKTPLLARTMAIDALGKFTSNDPKITAQQKSYLQCLLKNDTYLKKLENDNDTVFYMIHVVQALGNMGTAAGDTLADIARVRGYEANLNSAVETAVAAIQNPADSRSTSKKEMKDYLTDLANLKDADARLVAAKSLGQFIDPTVLQPLANAKLTDPDADVRLVAGNALTKVTALVQLNSEQNQAGLVAMLDKSNDIAVRVMAAKALGRIEAKTATKATIDALKTAGNDDDADLKVVAQNALKRIQ